MTQPSPQPAAPLTMGPIEWAMLFALAALWGGSFLFNAIAVRALPTLTIVALRVAIAAAVLWAIVAAIKRPLPRNPKVWLAFLGMGILNNVIPFSLIVWAQHSITSGLASILNATTPLCTVAVAGIFLADERISLRKLVGIMIGFSGVVVMIGPAALMGQDMLAQIACLGAALSYAFAGVFGRRFRRFGLDPIVVAAGQVTGAALVLTPLAFIWDAPINMPPLDAIGAVLALAVLCTALAYSLYFQILARAGATQISLVTFLVPVVAITLGATVLDEPLRVIQIIGMGLIGLGLLAIDGRILRKTIR